MLLYCLLHVAGVSLLCHYRCFTSKTEVWDQLLLASGKTLGKPGTAPLPRCDRHDGWFQTCFTRFCWGDDPIWWAYFSRGLVQPPTIVNCWFGARWFGILRLIQILLVTFLGWLSDPCKCESRPPYTTLNHLVPDNHWGLVYSRGLGSPNHQSWDPMVLRTFGKKNKNMPEKQKLNEVFFFGNLDIATKSEIWRQKTIDFVWLLWGSRTKTPCTVAGLNGPLVVVQWWGVEARWFSRCHEAMGTFLMSPEKNKTL